MVIIMLNEAETMTDANREGAAADAAKEYLSFVSDGIHFVVNASNVIEIIMSHTFTRLPKTPEYIKGIINLRGQIIPIIDVRLKMNKPDMDYGENACIIVVDVNSTVVGLLVESVSHVVKINSEDISPVPPKNMQELVSGIARIGDEVYLMLDCDLIIT